VGEQAFFEEGFYGLITTLPNGCKRIVNLNLSVIPLVTSVITETLCEGESYFLGDEEITESGLYEISLISASGCDSIVSATLTFISVNANIEQAGPILTAYADPDYEYQWFDCDSGNDIDTAQSNIFEAPYSGTFAVRITHEIGCVKESLCFEVIAGSFYGKSIVEPTTLYPNPSSGLIFIEGPASGEIYRIQVFDRAGKKVMDQSQNGMNMVLLDHLIPGIYFLKIYSGDSVIGFEICLTR